MTELQSGRSIKQLLKLRWRQDHLESKQKQARKKGRGVWSEDNYVSPGKFERHRILHEKFTSKKSDAKSKGKIHDFNRIMTPQEVASALRKAKDKGLPDGWTVIFDNKRQKRLWISPSGRKCDSLPLALVLSGVSQPKDRSLTQEEVDSALREAKFKGLPDGWSVVWNNKQRRKLWLSPTGGICDSLPKALVRSGVRGKKIKASA
jgi:hypothetical protein